MVKEKKKYNTFAVIFFINKAKAKKNGMCTIMGRISVSGEIAQFSTKIDVDPTQWDAKAYRIKGKGNEANDINRKLALLTEDITENYRETIKSQSYVTAEILKNKISDIGQNKKTILAFFAEHNDEFAKSVGISHREVSYRQYCNIYNHTKKFISSVYNVEDIALSKLDMAFIEKFHIYLKRDNGFGVATIKGYTNSLKMITKRAVRMGIIRKDPFVNFSAERPKSSIRYMNEDDLQKLMSTPIKSKALCFIRDMFVFSTFTGVPFADIVNLKVSSVHQKGKQMWLEFKRQKTQNDCCVPLLEIPRKIIKKYEGERTGDRVFNMVTSATMQENLEKVVKLCGITSKVNYHCARHNFGTLITLLNGVPLETVSKMMGHSKISTTEIYAHITSQKVADDMRKLSSNISGKYNVFEDNEMPIITSDRFYKHMTDEKRYNNNR